MNLVQKRQTSYSKFDKLMNNYREYRQKEDKDKIKFNSLETRFGH